MSNGGYSRRRGCARPDARRFIFLVDEDVFPLLTGYLQVDILKGLCYGIARNSRLPDQVPERRELLPPLLDGV
jgi:hypothetical protein